MIDYCLLLAKIQMLKIYPPPSALWQRLNIRENLVTFLQDVIKYLQDYC